jgi:hypothetical protein
MRCRRVLIAALGAMALTGCGASERDADVIAATERFHAAIETQDAETACDLLSPDTSSKLEQQEKAPCEETILALELPAGATATSTSIHMTTAAVALAEGGSTFLDEFDDGWKVSAAGCDASGPNLPYECELEG